jgi:hypothetical protein
MKPDLYAHRRLYLLHAFALGFARIFFVAAFALLFAGAATAGLLFIAGWLLLTCFSLTVSFFLRCQVCGARQTISHVPLPARTATGALRNPVARFFCPDPIALGTFNCWSCEERFALTPERAY